MHQSRLYLYEGSCIRTHKPDIHTQNTREKEMVYLDCYRNRIINEWNILVGNRDEIGERVQNQIYGDHSKSPVRL